MASKTAFVIKVFGLPGAKLEEAPRLTAKSIVVVRPYAPPRILVSHDFRRGHVLVARQEPKPRP